MEQKMKARIYSDHFTFQQGLWIYYEHQGKTYVAKPVKLVFEELDISSAHTRGPTIRVDGYQGKEFFESLAEELSKSGIKGPEKEKVFGLLEAQTKHLADLRTLLHLDPPQSAKPPEGEIKL
jgi:hypothetical protein